MTPSYMSLKDAAEFLTNKLNRKITIENILAYAENEKISIFARINRDAKFIRVNPIEGEPNEFHAFNGALPRLSSNAVKSLLLTGHTEYKEHTNIEEVDYFGFKEMASVVTFRIADGQVAPETTIEYCRVSKESLEQIELLESLLIAGEYSNLPYWLNLSIWTAKEAANLIFFTNPDSSNNGFNSDIQNKINDFIRHAERAQLASDLMANASPYEWIKWAKNNNYSLPTQLIDFMIRQEKNNQIEIQILTAELYSLGGKENAIDYNYWLNLGFLTPLEAIMLLNIDHPKRPMNTFSIEHKEKLEKELRQAERAQMAGKVPEHASPLDWYNWAKENNFTIPTQFNAILCSPQIELNVSPQNLDNADKPWLIANSSDPVAAYTWYIPARYFARETLKTEPTLLAKKDILAGRVNTLFKNFGIKKRGGINDFDDSTIKKAFRYCWI